MLILFVSTTLAAILYYTTTAISHLQDDLSLARRFALSDFNGLEWITSYLFERINGLLRVRSVPDTFRMIYPSARPIYLGPRSTTTSTSSLFIVRPSRRLI